MGQNKFKNKYQRAIKFFNNEVDPDIMQDSLFSSKMTTNIRKQVVSFTNREESITDIAVDISGEMIYDGNDMSYSMVKENVEIDEQALDYLLTSDDLVFTFNGMSCSNHGEWTESGEGNSHKFYIPIYFWGDGEGAIPLEFNYFDEAEKIIVYYPSDDKTFPSEPIEFKAKYTVVLRSLKADNVRLENNYDGNKHYFYYKDDSIDTPNFFVDYCSEDDSITLGSHYVDGNNYDVGMDLNPETKEASFWINTEDELEDFSFEIESFSVEFQNKNALIAILSDILQDMPS